eukprot:m.43148 g.43148  ORF g.43148 m.43148 type:complete len:886 (-) comp7094_c0_seq1:160-2817(-)
MSSIQGMEKDSAHGSYDEGNENRKETSAFSYVQEREIEDDECVAVLCNVEKMMKMMLQSVQDEGPSFRHDDALFESVTAFSLTKEKKPMLLKALSRRLHIVEVFVNFVEKIQPITSHHYDCIEHPMLFFKGIANTPMMRDALANNGIYDALVNVFSDIATVSLLENRVLTPWIVILIVSFLKNLCNDYSTNFKYAKPLVANAKFAQSFGTIFNLIWNGIVDDHKRILVSTGFVLCSSAYRCGYDESFIELGRFPMAALDEVQRDNTKFELVFLIIDGFKSGPFLVRKILNHIPDVIEIVISTMEKADFNWRVSNPLVLFNGTNSEAGTQAILPYVERIFNLFKSCKKYSRLYVACFGAIGNICRYTSHEQRQVLRDMNIVEAFSELMRSTKAKDRPAQAACIVANLIGHIDSHPLLSGAGEVIDLLALSLKKAWDDESFQGSLSEPWEPLQALSRFATADDNKEKLTATCVDLILEILESPKCQDERTENFAIVTLCTLAQRPTFGESTPRVKAIFRKIKEEGISDFARRQAAIGLFLLEKVVSSASDDANGESTAQSKRTNNRRKRTRRFLSRKLSHSSSSSTLSKISNHIMLSYPWAYQSIIKKILSSLKMSGYNVWVDIERMEGSILEAMASAVEQADVVIVCLCEAYFISNACRTEAQYAYKLGKPFVFIRVEDYVPIGWLGALCGTNLYVNFIGNNMFNTQLPKLLKEINRYVSPFKVKGDSPLSSDVVQQQVQSLRNEVTYWKKKADAAGKEVDKLQSTSDMSSIVRREMTKLKFELCTLTSSLYQRAESMKTANKASDVAVCNSDQDVAMQQMKCDITIVKNEVNNLTNELGGIKKVIGSMNNRMENMNAAMDALNSNMQALTKDVKSILACIKDSRV